MTKETGCAGHRSVSFVGISWILWVRKDLRDNPGKGLPFLFFG